MAPKLRVLAGTSLENMVPITSIVNTNQPHKLSSDLFEGEVVAHIQNFVHGDGSVRESEYFSREDRQGTTWSIQVQGRFLIPYSADDILFGNTFDRPLKLPWGTGAVLKFMNYIDPTLEHDLQSATKPWALSPLVSTMPYFMHRRVPRARSPSLSRSETSVEDQIQTFPPAQSITDSTPDLYKTLRDWSSSSGSSSSSSSSIHSTLSGKSNTSLRSRKSDTIKSALKKVTQRKKNLNRAPPEEMHFENAAARRSYFSTAAHRQAVVFGPSDIITTDFCYGFIEFSPTLALKLPGGLSFDLMRYWDGQPVRFVCCERRETTDAESVDCEPWGRIFWCIAIETYDDEDDDERTMTP
ncbi:hypothetical protein D9756_006564 [Leucocoprinus leucothites]|uniref:Domain of unknown function at the cortex 1 domain-containing protein n=1 Tax=Leucocoprinus leucothites TaxID=201217 RepID=A0A8H5LGZ5_9AGAR|nr:hypothetical protein D9756_006564 [Leucoagaricus leucothites]